MRISLSNKLALLFAGVTFLAIGVLYLYVAPGLQTRLIDQKLSELALSAQRHSAPIESTVGSADTVRAIHAAGQRRGARLWRSRHAVLGRDRSRPGRPAADPDRRLEQPGHGGGLAFPGRATRGDVRESGDRRPSPPPPARSPRRPSRSSTRGGLYG